MIRLGSLKNIALALSIAIVLNVFIGVGVSSFYPGPEYEDFCEPYVRPLAPVGEEIPSAEEIQKMEQCNEDFNTARDLYNRNVFLVFLVGGLVAIGIGWRVTTSSAVSAGLTYGGVLAFLVGTIRWWSGMQDILRFIIVGAVLLILVWLGMRKRKINSEQ